MPTPNYELLKEAYAIIGGIPARKINLEAIITDRGPSLACGTIACAAGWLAMHPKFKDMGLGLNPHGGGLAVNGIHTMFDTAMAQVFGITVGDAMDLFGTRHFSRFDSDLPQHLGDKALWKARVKAFLRAQGQLKASA